jgi:predicted metal-dependent peptidase
MLELDTKMNTEERITKAKVLLQHSHPFFAYILSMLKIQEDKNGVLKFAKAPMGVDAKGNLYYDKEKVNKWSMDIMKGVLCHETMHVAMEHMTRKGSRHHLIWNIANDIVINNMLVQNDMSLPKPCDFIPDNNELTLKGKGFPTIVIKEIDRKTSNEIYDILYKVLKDKLPQQICVAFGIQGDGEDGKGYNGGFDLHIISDKATDSKEGKGSKGNIDWEQVIIDAYNHATMQGTKPKGLGRVIDGIVKPKVSWRNLLYQYITRELPIDWNYNYPSKRGLATGIYMPSVKRENIEIVATIDTSGSIDSKILKQFVSELIAISKSVEFLKATVLVGDCQVHEVIPVENGNIKKLEQHKFKGGGGTDTKPFQDWVKNNKPDCKVIIHLTDGYTEWYDTPEYTKFNTIWVLTDGSNAERIPFGRKIVISVDEDL